jgi:hypothetical protein
MALESNLPKLGSSLSLADFPLKSFIHSADTIIDSDCISSFPSRRVLNLDASVREARDLSRLK